MTFKSSNQKYNVNFNKIQKNRLTYNNLLKKNTKSSVSLINPGVRSFSTGSGSKIFSEVTNFVNSSDSFQKTLNLIRYNEQIKKGDYLCPKKVELEFYEKQYLQRNARQGTITDISLDYIKSLKTWDDFFEKWKEEDTLRRELRGYNSRLNNVLSKFLDSESLNHHHFRLSTESGEERFRFLDPQVIFEEMSDNFIKNYHEILHKKLLNDTVNSYHSEVINLCNLNFDTLASLLPIMVGFYHMLLITEDPSLSQELLAVHDFFKGRSFFISIFEDIAEEYSYYSKRMKQRAYCASN